MADTSEPSEAPPEPYTPVVEHWCDSHVQVDTLTYTWDIDHFSLRPEGVGEYIKSSEFASSASDMQKWCLRAYPNGDNEQNKDFLSIHLFLVSCDDREVCARFLLALINDKREETYNWEIPQTHRFVKGSSWAVSDFIKRDDLLDEANGLLPCDTLRIFCELTIVSDNENFSGQSIAVEVDVPECRLSEDLGSLLANGRFSDVTLSVKGREFQAHKNILAERSRVFAAMFAHDMEEQRHNTVNITDIDYEVFKEMLSFIYTGRTKTLENIAQDLLPAADKYALERLKAMCEEALCKSLSVENVLDILILADVHSARQLKEQAINYIHINCGDVMQTQAWKTMIQSHPHLITEVFRFMTMQQARHGGPQSKRVKKS